MILTRMKFIELWQASNYIDEFCQKSGMKYNAARIRANELRRAGIPLKLLPKNPPLNQQIEFAQALNDS